MKLKELLLCTMMASLGSVAYAAPGSVSIEKFKKQPLAFAASKPADNNGFFVQKAMQSPTMLNTASSDFQLKTSTWGFLTSVSGTSWLFSNRLPTVRTANTAMQVPILSFMMKTMLNNVR